MSAPALVWFRQDLRLADNRALAAAARGGRPILPLFIWAPEEEGDWAPGGASRWWLHRSLESLSGRLRSRGLQLILRRGGTVENLRAMAAESGATQLHFSRRYEPAAVAQEQTVASALRNYGVEAHGHNSALMLEPWSLHNSSGQPFRVYGAFRRRALTEIGRGLPPIAKPRVLSPPGRWPQSLALSELQLLPQTCWYDTLAQAWEPGEVAALKRLRVFLTESLATYARQRDFPGVAGTSRLSPHLHFGEIGPRQIWHALGPGRRASRFVDELLWREFANHLLHHYPASVKEPLRPEFRNFPWRRDAKVLHAWERGRTGIPFIDAGMSELWTTGWMHNRVRMVTASFLVKNLLQPWQQGARWFWDTLVDADLASNTLNWQWVAGCGTDAAPFFRIFNPYLQARRYDRDGTYVRRWVAAQSEGTMRPIVDIARSRDAALEAYRAAREAAQKAGPRKKTPGAR